MWNRWRGPALAKPLQRREGRAWSTAPPGPSSRSHTACVPTWRAPATWPPLRSWPAVSNAQPPRVAASRRGDAPRHARQQPPHSRQNRQPCARQERISSGLQASSDAGTRRSASNAAASSAALMRCSAHGTGSFGSAGRLSWRKGRAIGAERRRKWARRAGKAPPVTACHELRHPSRADTRAASLLGGDITAAASQSCALAPATRWLTRGFSVAATTSLAITTPAATCCLICNSRQVCGWYHHCHYRCYVLSLSDQPQERCESQPIVREAVAVCVK